MGIIQLFLKTKMDSKTGHIPLLEEDIVKLQNGMISAIEKNDPKIRSTRIDMTEIVIWDKY